MWQVPVVINENPYVLRVNEESGRFKMMVLASSKVEAEMSVMMTKPTEVGWENRPIPTTQTPFPARQQPS